MSSSAMSSATMSSAIDTDDEISEFLNKFAFDPVFDGNDTMIDVTNVVGDRDVAVRVTAMETFYERMRPEQDVVLPTGYTLHQTRVLRALAPINAHIMLADKNPGRSGMRKVTAYVPSRAQMRLFHLLFGDQFSFEVVEHKVDGKQMPHQGGQNSGAGPVAEVGVDTVHHAFARVRITLHLAGGQTRTFEGVGMAQDIASNSDTIPLAEFYASRRSGKGVVTDAWRSAIERISPVFRSAYYEGSEMLDKVRELILRKISVSPPNIRTLGPVSGRIPSQNGPTTVTHLRSAESIAASPIPRARAKAADNGAEEAGAAESDAAKNGRDSHDENDGAGSNKVEKPAPARRGVRIGSRPATAARPATANTPSAKTAPAKTSPAKTSAKGAKDRKKTSAAENGGNAEQTADSDMGDVDTKERSAGAAKISPDRDDFEDEIPDFGQHGALRAVDAAATTDDAPSAEDTQIHADGGAKASAESGAESGAKSGDGSTASRGAAIDGPSEEDIAMAKREIMLDLGIDADDDLGDLDADTAEEIKREIEKRLAEIGKVGRVSRETGGGGTSGAEVRKNEAGARDVVASDAVVSDAAASDRDGTGQSSADIVVSASIATAADLLAAYEELFINNSTADVLAANKASSKRLLKAKDLAALGDLVNRFNDR